ncbi:F-box protein PP2-B15-like [Carica papaya]|uniref:F-box protein PP2-B15-like n=1 Tax=Carica papaya TaxID=3649 RepID=UPI000B8CC03F|nr:F-box protein PP2-B15-like [Carica papaya]
MEKMEVADCNVLPEGCIATILSFTTPRDACRSAMASEVFRSAAESDIVWERFLPPDCNELLSRLVTPLEFSSKKELFLQLCNSVLIDGGKKSFKLEKSSGKKSFTLSARELSITWSNNPMYWSWVPTNESRFTETAVLRTTWWLEIHGKINTKILSPNTTYGAYLIMRITKRKYGLDTKPSEISVEVGDRKSTGIAYLLGKRSGEDGDEDDNSNEVEESKAIFPKERVDGWMEIELGEFFNGGGLDQEVNMSLTEVRGYRLKAGVVIEGIEVRPKH